MSARETVKLGPFAMPPRLKGKLATRAARHKTSFNDVTVEILCQSAGIAYEPTRRPPRTIVSPKTRVILDAPPELARWVRRRADELDESQRDVVVRILSISVGLDFVPGGRWPTRQTTEVAS